MSQLADERRRRLEQDDPHALAYHDTSVDSIICAVSLGSPPTSTCRPVDMPSGANGANTPHDEEPR